MEKLDKQIILAMQEDGRMTNTQLARRFGVSESTIRNHVNYLLQSKVMKVKAVMSPDQIGNNLICIIGFHVKTSDMHQVTEYLKKQTNIFYLAVVTGRYDIIAFALTKNSEELASFLENIVSNNPDILGTETFVNLEVAKNPWIESWGTKWIIGNLET
jgi:Lrp/AsnC family transcriptional regulator, regulator for asnA, asnC and gidA